MNRAKEIIILSASPMALSEVQRFMWRRDYSLAIHSDLRGFLNKIVECKPEYAFVSCNFAHESMPRLRRLMEEVYRVKVVDFVEDQSRESANNLAKSNGTRKIPHCMTGPALERFMMGEVKNKKAKEPSTQFRDHINRLMSEVFELGNGVVHQPLTWTNRVTCLQVTSPSMKGHMVVALGKDRSLDAHTIQQIEQQLSQIATELYGESVQTSSFELEIQRVEFKRWAGESAALFERTVHNGVEVAAAFFPVDEEENFDVPMDGEMVSIDLSRLDTEHNFGFELYLHLPLSNKFLLYVPRGSRLTETQNQTLRSRGIMRLHVPKAEMSALERDRFRSRCNRLISSFYESRASA